jgi:DNA adenine methylase
MGEKARPFLKWAGGKTRYATTLVALAPNYSGTYWEPFMGSAAVFFELAPDLAVLSDANPELVTCFQEVARDPHGVMELLDEMPNTKEFFLSARGQDPAALSAPERAARVIYLNKTGFRGLWRVNRAGEFNAPYGAYNRPYYNADNLLRASKALASAQIRHADFAATLHEARPGDWVYLDPPYVPDRPWGDFKRYTSDQFYESDHERLAELMRQAGSRGVHVMLTNSDTATVREIFHGFTVTELPTRRDIHLRAAERASRDLILTNYSDFRHPQLLDSTATTV